MPDEDAEQTEVERVYHWRLAELERAGYPETAARLIAGDTSIDLHDAVDLLARGCPVIVAIRICGATVQPYLTVP